MCHCVGHATHLRTVVFNDFVLQTPQAKRLDRPSMFGKAANGALNPFYLKFLGHDSTPRAALTQPLASGLFRIFIGGRIIRLWKKIIAAAKTGRLEFPPVIKAAGEHP
jgi:hypothetical protein